MLMRIRVAPVDCARFRAAATQWLLRASVARCAPLAVAVPIDGITHAAMMAFTSAKSRLMMPECDDVRDTLHPFGGGCHRHTEARKSQRPERGRQLFVGRTMCVSTESIIGNTALRLLHAAFAFEREWLGDNRDRERSHSLASDAMMGAAPVPVPRQTGGDETPCRRLRALQ